VAAAAAGSALGQQRRKQAQYPSTQESILPSASPESVLSALCLISDLNAAAPDISVAETRPNNQHLTLNTQRSQSTKPRARTQLHTPLNSVQHSHPQRSPCTAHCQAPALDVHCSCCVCQTLSRAAS
jgi:hypothetical protein